MEGNIAFGSTLQGWAFTLQTIAQYYAKKFDMNIQTLSKRLWGNFYYDPDHRKVCAQSTTANGKLLSRTAVELVFQPISKLCNAITLGERSAVEKML